MRETAIDVAAPESGISNDEVLRLLQILNLPAGCYAVCGGALLAHHGLRINTNDVDLLVMPALYDRLLGQWKARSKSRPDCPAIMIDGIRVEAFASINFADSEKAIEYIERQELGVTTGIPLVRLQDMLDWKRLIMKESPLCKRAKDHLRDIALMEKALG